MTNDFLVTYSMVAGTISSSPPLSSISVAAQHSLHNTLRNAGSQLATFRRARPVASHVPFLPARLDAYVRIPLGALVVLAFARVVVEDGTHRPDISPAVAVLRRQPVALLAAPSGVLCGHNLELWRRHRRVEVGDHADFVREASGVTGT